MKKVTVKAEYGNKLAEQGNLDEWQRKAHPYTVTVKYDKKQMTIPFFMGMAHTSEPTAEDVMPCLASDYDIYQNYEFEDFCNEFGYDLEDKNSKKIFKMCEKNGKNVERVFGFDADLLGEKYSG